MFTNKKNIVLKLLISDVIFEALTQATSLPLMYTYFSQIQIWLLSKWLELNSFLIRDTEQNFYYFFYLHT